MDSKWHDPEYRSPLNRWYRSVKWPGWVIALNRWMDRLFGKG
jgi:hypothetical protein